MLLAAAVCAVTLAACGDDEGEVKRSGTGTSTAGTATGDRTGASTVEKTATEAEPETAPAPADTGEVRSPEDQPGGAGDEEPARSEALFTGRGGRITPRVVLVPPFISVRVQLRSDDGRGYRLRTGRRTLTAGPRRVADSITFDGLRPGRRIVLRGTGGRVIVEASAEPGP